MKKKSLTAFTPLEEINHNNKCNPLMGFTLIELLIVAVILAVLAGVVIPNFSRVLERAKDKEAVAALNMIASAQEIYYLKCGYYYGFGDNISDINTYLNLNLKEEDWDYKIWPIAGSSSYNTRLIAQRNVAVTSPYARYGKAVISRDVSERSDATFYSGVATQ